METTITTRVYAVVSGYDRSGIKWVEKVDAEVLDQEIQRQKDARCGNTQYLTTVVGEAIAKLTGLDAESAGIKHTNVVDISGESYACNYHLSAANRVRLIEQINSTVSHHCSMLEQGYMAFDRIHAINDIQRYAFEDVNIVLTKIDI